MLGPTISPTSIRVDASTICQLRCPHCPTTHGDIGRNLGSGFLTFGRFRRLVAGGTIEHVELSNWGENFLNPHLVEILEYAFRKNIKLTADNGANLNHLQEGVAEALVEYAFHTLSCSIDGATQETYSIHRRRGSLERVLRNVERINAAKLRSGATFPILRWQFVVFGHNEHEIPAAKAMARQLGMEISFKLSWAENVSPVRDPQFVKEHTGLAAVSRSEYRKLSGQRYRQKLCCAQLWNMPALNWDGRVLGCSVNRWGDFGAAGATIEETMNSDRMRYARRMLLGKAPARADIPCSRCHNYRHMLREGDWLTGEQVATFRAELPLARASRRM
jgi:MoaA/NifB/PqqE/SkfB family radical SAM enzyme